MRRHVLQATGLAMAAAVALTGCGGTGEVADAEASVATEAAFPRTVEHAMGATDIPARPERVVVLDTGELDSVLSLGVTPVGAVTTAVSQAFLSYLAEGAADVEVVGTIAEPNLEAIAALQPDLILSNKVRHLPRSAAPGERHRGRHRQSGRLQDVPSHRSPSRGCRAPVGGTGSRSGRVQHCTQAR